MTFEWDIPVSAEPSAIVAAIGAVFERHNFKLTWEDRTTATAESGSKFLNFFAGSFAQYYKIGLRVMNPDQGECTVRLEEVSRGWMGGLMGTAKTRAMLTELRSELELAFSDAGILRH